MTFNIQQEFSEIKKRYEEDTRNKSFNALICGESGSGKTHLLRTARRPVLVDSFDPGGTRTLRDLLEGPNHVYADTRWEAEDPQKPTAYSSWVSEHNRRMKDGVYDHLGTYCLDSLTMFQEAVMNFILARAGIAGDTPRFTKDYSPQKTRVKNAIKQLLSLPCDVIITGHLAPKEDEVTGATTYRLETTGNNVTYIPLLFDEVYVMDTKETSKGVKYRLLTQSTGRYVASSRLAQGGKLDPVEEPDLKNLLRKAGLDPSDKEVTEVFTNQTER